MINVILQFLELDLVNINVSAKFYQNIPNGLRVEFHCFQNLNLGKTSTNPKCHLTISWGYIMSISMCMQNFIIIFHSVQEIGHFHFFRIWSSAEPRTMKNVISQSLGLDLININVYAKVYQNIPLSSRDRAIFTFSEFEPRQRLGQFQMTFDNPLGYNINAYAKFYQNIPNGLRVNDIFHKQAGDKIVTNSPRTKSSQTVRRQNQMFEYWALYEIQLQVSLDFLRVVQL